MVVTDAQVHPSRRNNVEPSNAQSTADGRDILHTVPALRAAVVVPKQVSDIAHIPHQDTTATHAEVIDRNRSPVTPITVPLMELTLDGLNGRLAVLPVEVALRPGTERARHPNMEAWDVRCSDMQSTHVNATPTFAH